MKQMRFTQRPTMAICCLLTCGLVNYSVVCETNFFFGEEKRKKNFHFTDAWRFFFHNSQCPNISVSSSDYLQVSTRTTTAMDSPRPSWKSSKIASRVHQARIFFKWEIFFSSLYKYIYFFWIGQWGSFTCARAERVVYYTCREMYYILPTTHFLPINFELYDLFELFLFFFFFCLPIERSQVWNYPVIFLLKSRALYASCRQVWKHVLARNWLA